jgi:hypothetical protein
MPLTIPVLEAMFGRFAIVALIVRDNATASGMTPGDHGPISETVC